MKLHLPRLGEITEATTGRLATWNELAREIERRAGLLARQGVGRGTHVVIAHGGTISFFADLFATWRTGACAACVDPQMTRSELTVVAQFLQPNVILVEDGSNAAVDVAIPLLCLRREDSESMAVAEDSELDDPALILFTSGTTGEPKGVVHSFRSLLARIALNRQVIGDRALARTLCLLPSHFGHGLIGNCLTPLLAGARLVLMPGTGTKTAAALAGAIDDHDISFMSSVPSFWKLALKVARPPRRGSLRQVNVGSAPLTAELWRAVQGWAGTDHVVNAYGITETANWAAGASGRDHRPADGLVGSMWGGRAAVRSEDGRILGIGDGELLLQTPALMQGYHERPDLTRAALRDGWFQTGDIGGIDDRGIIRLLGRQKHEINRGGQKVHPEEIDALLERHPDVLEACTFGLPDEASGEIVAVALSLRDGVAGDAAALRRWCLERVRRELAPERWFFLPSIPKTGRGKVDRRAVLAACTGATP